MRHLVYFAVVTLFSLPCHPQTNGSLLFDGQTRNYIVYTPTGFNPQEQLPLVMVLHGFTQSAQNIMDVSNFNAIAEANNFIAVYPNGVGNAWNTNSGFPGGSTANDIGFLAALVTEMRNLYNIDTSRVYSCGFSAGGYMSHRLACESNICLAAIASVSGTMSDAAYNDCTPWKNIPVMQIHGTSDLVVFYNGGLGSKSVTDVVNFWVTNNGCPNPATVTNLPDINTSDGSTVQRFEYQPCTDQTRVELLKVNGGGHQWPGTSASLGGLGSINQDISASQEIWNFFSNFRCVNCNVWQPQISGNVTVCSNGTYLYQAAIPTPYSTYTWSVTGGVIVSGQGTPQIEVQWNSGVAGMINLVQTGY